MRRGSIVGLAALPALMLTACAIDGLQFRESDRIVIESPDDDGAVGLPVVITWVDNAETTATRFAVFIDRTPQKKGKTVESLFIDKRRCRPERGCPDEAFLADRGVFVVDGTSITVDTIDRGDVQGRQREFHDVTIIPLDVDGRRLGEASTTRRFELDRTLNS
jgi:hypothetical protein